RVDRGTDENFPLNDEAPRRATRLLLGEKIAQSADRGAREPAGRLAQPRAPLASATRRPKASMSWTARSARILRSTSIPAALRPAMKRL
ncbi:MAG: hypothetical protein RL743_779, partial [Actinomycetota bacterium]